MNMFVLYHTYLYSLFFFPLDLFLCSCHCDTVISQHGINKAYPSKANHGRVYTKPDFTAKKKKKLSCTNIFGGDFVCFLRQVQKKCWVSKTTTLLCTWWMIDEKLSGSLALISSGVNPVKSFPAESVIKETCFPLKETFQAQGL